MSRRSRYNESHKKQDRETQDRETNDLDIEVCSSAGALHDLGLVRCATI